MIAESEGTISAPDRNVPVIPLLLDGATMPRADELPPSLVWLVRRQAPRTRPSPASTMTPSRLSKPWTQLLPKSRPAEPTCRAGGLSERRAKTQGGSAVRSACSVPQWRTSKPATLS